MEKLFKRHFWLVHAVMVAAVAFLCARTASQLGGQWVAGLLQDGKAETTTARSIAPVGKTRNFDEAAEYNIFGAFREVVSPLAVEAVASCTTDKDCGEGEACLPVENPAEGEPALQCQPEGEIDLDLANAVKSELPLKLVGTSVFSYPEDSLASLVDVGKGRNAEGDIYSINDCPPALPALPVAPEPEEDEEAEVDPTVELMALERAIQAAAPPCNLLLEEHKLLHVAIDRVYVLNAEQKRTEYIALDEPPEPPKNAAKARKPRKPVKKGKDKKDDELGAGITKVGANSYEIKQEEVAKAMGNLSKIATKARIVPAFEGGKSVGFKLFSIRPGSVYSKIGIQNGDIVQGVNGYDLNSPDKALELYQKLKDGKEFSVDIKRRGKPVTLDYAIVP